MTPSESQVRFATALKTLAQKKTMEKISTEEIVKTAGISRQTFYKYFVDKYDLAFWCYTTDMMPIIQRYKNQNISFHDMNVIMLKLMLEERDFYRNVWVAYETQNSFFKQYHELSYNQTVSYFGRTDKMLRAVIDQYCYGSNMMIMNWVAGGMQESVEFMADLFDQALPECMKSLLNE